MPILEQSQSQSVSEPRPRFRSLQKIMAILVAIFTGEQAAAEDVSNCTVEAPVDEFPLIAGDFPPNGPWMTKQILGRTIIYENGMTERFNKDGTYEVSVSGQTRGPSGQSSLPPLKRYLVTTSPKLSSVPFLAIAAFAMKTVRFAAINAEATLEVS